jgi:hypothetical protein
MVDNSAFSPKRLTILSTLLILPLNFPFSSFQAARILMTLHLFLFLLLFLLMLFLARLCHLYWPYHCPPHPRAAAVHTTIQRLLKPRSPLDCPACRLSSTLSSVMEPAPLPVRPWREIKSRRGAPKRMNTQGYACPNHKCLYFGITDADIHASFWGWHAWPC